MTTLLRRKQVSSSNHRSLFSKPPDRPPDFHPLQQLSHLRRPQRLPGTTRLRTLRDLPTRCVSTTQTSLRRLKDNKHQLLDNKRKGDLPDRKAAWNFWV